MNYLGKDLRKVAVILKEKYYNGIESGKTFKCETGSGCTPDSISTEIIVTFTDGEKGRSSRERSILKRQWFNCG